MHDGGGMERDAGATQSDRSSRRCAVPAPAALSPPSSGERLCCSPSALALDRILADTMLLHRAQDPGCSDRCRLVVAARLRRLHARSWAVADRRPRCLCCCCVSARLTLDFDTNKKIAEEVAIIPSKRLRNQIAGFVTHLMKRIQRGGSVRGISLKLQVEERERRLDFIPEKSILDVDVVDIDADTADLLKSIDFGDLAGVSVQQAQHAASYVHKRPGQGDRKPFGGKQGDKKQGPRVPRQPKVGDAAAAPAAASAAAQ